MEDTAVPVQPLCKNDTPLSSKDEGTIVAEKTHKHKKKRKRHYEDAERSHDYHVHKKHAKLSRVSWLAPNLRVRIISKDYCKGKYYNEKVSVSGGYIGNTKIACCSKNCIFFVLTLLI